MTVFFDCFFGDGDINPFDIQTACIDYLNRCLGNFGQEDFFCRALEMTDGSKRRGMQKEMEETEKWN